MLLIELRSQEKLAVYEFCYACQLTFFVNRFNSSALKERCVRTYNDIQYILILQVVHLVEHI